MENGCINYFRNVNHLKREEHVKKGHDGCVYGGGVIMLDYETLSFLSLLLKTYHNKTLSQKRVVKLKK